MVILDPQPPGWQEMDARFKSPPLGFHNRGPNRPAQSPSPLGPQTLPGTSYKPTKAHHSEFLPADVAEGLL